MKASTRPSGDKVGDMAESVKLVRGRYCTCRTEGDAEEFFRDANQNAAIPATATAASPAAAIHLPVRLRGAATPWPLRRWVARKAATRSRIEGYRSCGFFS